MFNPRPAQKEVIAYSRGYMGVSAVPGSGKTHTLSYLAAKLIAEGKVIDEQEVLIVTLVNSAVENFSQRIRGFLQERKLISNLGYRIRTLHGLAHDIIRERPDLVGLDTQFSIIDETEQRIIITELARAWAKNHPEFKELYLDKLKEKSMRPDSWVEFIADLGSAFINTSKDFRKTPAWLITRYAKTTHNILLDLGLEIYKDYQNILSIRGAVDFSDLIWLAISALEHDSQYLQRLQRRWPYILEDEAQDSSQLQQTMLGLLAGNDGNWVRVGDPNQAIYETFTTANPRYLLDFIKRDDVINKDLPVSGRSTISIISLANELIRWSTSTLEMEGLRSALSLPYIKPATQHDPQPNPSDKPNGIYLYPQKLSEEKEIEVVVKSTKQWLEENPQKTLAILAPRNVRAAKIAEALHLAGVKTQELLHTTQSTRLVARKILTCVRFISEPSERNFQTLFQFFKEEVHDTVLEKELSVFMKEVTKRSELEILLFSQVGKDSREDIHPFLINHLENIRIKIGRWQNAALLPIDQFVLVISQDIFSDPVDLAISFKIAVSLERAKRVHPEWQLEDFCLELERLASNKTRFSGFSDADTGFDPDAYKGIAIVATIHKAKGLEWDRVYLVSVNNYDFPLNQSFDRYQGETWFIRGELNLQAELLALFDWLISDLHTNIPEFGKATTEARIQYAAERLRLFYVGITRARQELVVTWNSGRENLSPSFQAMAFNALCAFWEKQYVRTE